MIVKNFPTKFSNPFNMNILWSWDMISWFEASLQTTVCTKCGLASHIQKNQDLGSGEGLSQKAKNPINQGLPKHLDHKMLVWNLNWNWDKSLYSIILNHSNLKLLACLVLPTEKHPCLFIAQSYVPLSGGNLNWTQWNLFASKMHQTAMLMLHLLHLLYLLGNLLAPSDNSVSANKYMLNFSRNLMKEPCFAEEKKSDWQLLPATWRGNYHQLQWCLLPSLYNVLSNASKDHLMIDTWTYYDNFRGSTLHLECCHTLKTNITKDAVVSDLVKVLAFL